MPIRVIVNGAKGKMGSLACTTLATHPEFNLVAQLGRNDNLAATIKTSQAQIENVRLMQLVARLHHSFMACLWPVVLSRYVECRPAT